MTRTPSRGADLGHLMERAQAGDETAYLDLLQQISLIVRSATRRRDQRLQHADIEDIVQDVLVSVHLVRATYDPSRPFLPWLLTIVHNRMIDRYRKFARGAANEVLVNQIDETFSASEANTYDSSFGDEELLRQAIQELPASQRRAIELLKLREMSLKEAAAETGMSVGNLKVLVHRAIGSLRARMKTDHGD